MPSKPRVKKSKPQRSIAISLPRRVVLAAISDHVAAIRAHPDHIEGQTDRSYWTASYLHLRNYAKSTVVSLMGTNTVFSRELNFNTEVVSTAGSVVNQVFDMNPVNYFETTDMALIFDEYRIMGMGFEFFYTVPQAVGTGAGRFPLCFVYDNDDTSAIAAYSEAYGHSTKYVVQSGLGVSNSPHPISHTWKRPLGGGATAVLWVNLQSPSSLGALKLWCSGITASQSIGFIRTILHAEFRMLVNGT